MGLIGLDRTGPIESFVPPIAFAILFGLSMDYEVFLMSRIREEHVHGDDTVDAVKDGVAGVGRVIVAAALIMSSVFFSFLLSAGPRVEGVRPAARRRDPHRRAADAADARAGAADGARRALVVDPGLAREDRCRTSRSSRRAPVPQPNRRRARCRPTSRRAECRGSGSRSRCRSTATSPGRTRASRIRSGKVGSRSTSGCSRPSRSALRTGWPTAEGRPGSTTITRPARARTSARRSWAGTCSARSAAAGPEAIGRGGGATILRSTHLFSCSPTMHVSRCR